MTLRETDTIDYIYLEGEGDAAVLVVSDPMGWSPPEEEPHLKLLADKLETQIEFVNTGQIATVYPEFRDGKIVWVEVAAHCALSPRAYEFYKHAGGVMAENNMKLRLMLLS